MPAFKRKPSGRCKICQHSERSHIEVLLASGATVRAVTRKFNVPLFSLRRHWDNHVSDERKASMILGPVQRQALAARVCEENESVIDNFRIVRATLYRLLSAADEAGDGRTAASIASALHDNLNSLARLTGQLASSPLVQVNNTTVFMQAAGFAEFHAKLIETLRPFADARNAVIDLFESIDDDEPKGVTYDA